MFSVPQSTLTIPGQPLNLWTDSMSSNDFWITAGGIWIHPIFFLRKLIYEAVKADTKWFQFVISPNAKCNWALLQNSFGDGAVSIA